MTDAIQAGTILIEGGASMPAFLGLESRPEASGWRSIGNLDWSQLDTAIQQAGWTFFFMAGEIKATVFGFDRQKALRTALRRLIVDVKAQHCNSIEITQVTSKSFLNVPYVSVMAHPRHLQMGLLFSDNGNLL